MSAELDEGVLPIPMSALDAAIWEVRQECVKTMQRFAPLNSPHEGYAVIAEELDELWDHVKENTGRTGQARSEAMQTAAMAIRYMVDLTTKGPK